MRKNKLTAEVKAQIKELKKQERAEIAGLLGEGCLRYAGGSIFRLCAAGFLVASLISGLQGYMNVCIPTGVMTGLNVVGDIGDTISAAHGSQNSFAEKREDGAAAWRHIPFVRQKYKEMIAAVKEGREYVPSFKPSYDYDLEPEQDG